MRAGVPEDVGGIDKVQEAFGLLAVGADDAIVIAAATER
jgi:hypothetical protein